MFGVDAGWVVDLWDNLVRFHLDARIKAGGRISTG
jgi:hypothetical protein